MQHLLMQDLIAAALYKLEINDLMILHILFMQYLILLQFTRNLLLFQKSLSLILHKNVFCNGGVGGSRSEESWIRIIKVYLSSTTGAFIRGH